MARINPEESDTLVESKDCEVMIHGGRAMKGYLFLEPEAYEDDEELTFWINKCLEFNPLAKSSKKR